MSIAFWSSGHGIDYYQPTELYPVSLASHGRLLHDLRLSIRIGKLAVV